MPERDALIAAFAERAGWGEAARHPLAGDASNRRYLQLGESSGRTAVLMDAPPERGEDVGRFVAIARHLSGLRLSAPHILARDEAAGLLLLEDLGDGLLARLVADDPARERSLYLAAADTLAAMQSAPPPEGLQRFTPEVMADLVRLVFDWYAPGVAPQDADALLERLRAALDRTAAGPLVFAHRDFHAENLLWLPDRAGPARIGLLDFQDAVLAPPAYDLVSLLNDARRDVTEETRTAVIGHFIDVTGAEPRAFTAAAATLSVQRNLRILGIFARLARRDGKTGYLRFLPRVWRLLDRDLGHPALADVAELARRLLPPPETVMGEETACPAR